MIIDRIHIIVFVTLTIALWIAASWMYGITLVSEDFLKPFGIVVACLTVMSD